MLYSIDDFYRYANRPNNIDIRWDISRATGVRRKYFGWDEPKTVSRKNVKRYLFRVKDMMVNRTQTEGLTRSGSTIFVGKFHRPWDVVPALKKFRPPQGDYGYGLEIEFGFKTKEKAQDIACSIRNWKHVVMDFEGGRHGMETTFPPALFSKIHSNIPCFKYLKMLAKRGSGVIRQPDIKVGIHVNVSSANTLDLTRVNEVKYILSCLSKNKCIKYFGREYYPYSNLQKNYIIEWKLFNSVKDWKIARRYIHIAVSLTKLVDSSTLIDESSVLSALETGYNLKA